MARKIIHQLVDDLDGTVLEIGDGETVLFSIDGVSYEIDLTTTNARDLRDSLAPFVEAGRRVSTGRPVSQSRKRSSDVDLSAVRAWARENGHSVSDRGRVPGPVLAAYAAAN